MKRNFEVEKKKRKGSSSSKGSYKIIET